jgi:hypothetical protein
VLVSSGLIAGERVCISPLQVVVDGMKVKPLDVTPVMSESNSRLPIEAAENNEDAVIENTIEKSAKESSNSSLTDMAEL